MVARLDVRIPQTPEYLPGDAVRVFWNGGRGPVAESAPAAGPLELWPGQLLGGGMDEDTIDGGSEDGGAEAQYAADDGVADAGTVDEPAGEVVWSFADLGPGMYRVKVATEDAFANRRSAEFAHFLCTPPHAPWDLSAGPVSGRLTARFQPSRSLRK